jgi:transposase
MIGAYWSAINEHLPDAALVFDHFHIIKLANEKIDEIRRGLQRTLEVTGQKFIKPKFRSSRCLRGAEAWLFKAFRSAAAASFMMPP